MERKSTAEKRSEALIKAHEAAKAAREAGVVPQRKTWAERYAEKPKNLRLAIACQCHDCLGGEGVPGVREEIRGCTSKTCRLHPHRPYKMKGEE